MSVAASCRPYAHFRAHSPPATSRDHVPHLTTHLPATAFGDQGDVLPKSRFATRALARRVTAGGRMRSSAIRVLHRDAARAALTSTPTCRHGELGGWYPNRRIENRTAPGDHATSAPDVCHATQVPRTLSRTSTREV